MGLGFEIVPLSCSPENFPITKSARAGEEEEERTRARRADSVVFILVEVHEDPDVCSFFQSFVCRRNSSDAVASSPVEELALFIRPTSQWRISIA